jgi:methionine synthase II (cobalamin-independent)
LIYNFDTDFCSEKMLTGFRENNEDSTALLDAYIKLYNDCLSSRPSDLHVGVHLCRGNFVGSRHFSEGGYDAIATKLFKDLNVDTYYLEYDTERAGGFEPLKELPAHKNVILGLITSKFPELEDLEELKKKVHAAAEIVASGGGTKAEALARIGVSPQCGFASHSHGNSLSTEDMVAKLKLVRKLADEIWPGEP